MVTRPLVPCCRYNVYIKGQLVEPGDHIVFVRKDMALDGTDADPSTGLVTNNDAANCAQANAGTIPVGNEGADDTVTDYGGQVRRECLGVGSCDPATCKVYPEDDPLYHEDCRYASEMNMLGVQDTLHPSRKPWDEPLAIGSPPNSPPWFQTLTDNHTDNGIVPAQIAGSGQASETYDESGTYYLCYLQNRDASMPGYQTFTFLRYIVVHVSAHIPIEHQNHYSHSNWFPRSFSRCG